MCHAASLQIGWLSTEYPTILRVINDLFVRSASEAVFDPHTEHYGTGDARLSERSLTAAVCGERVRSPEG